MTSNVGFTGISSGLNTAGLIANIQRFSQQNINNLNQAVTTDQAQQTAIQGIQSSLQTLQNAASQLALSQGSVFDGKTVSSSNSSLVTAAAGTGAQTGITSLTVLALAQANQIASQGFSDPNSAITQGTFQIQAGSQSATISIDSTNATLSGLAQAINNAGIGVAATIVNTGSNDPLTQPYRLLLTSNATGTANAIQITNNLGASGSGAVLPDFNNTEIGPAVTSSGFSGTSSVTSNTGAGNYTGSANDTYTFTVVNGGTVGTTNGIQVAWSNSSGSETGTLTLNAADVNTPQSVVDGVQVQFGAGTLTTGDKFTVNVFSPTIQAASNAQIQLGSGAGAVTVQNSSNTLTNLIPGVTLSLQAADPTKSVQLNVANDVSSAATAITNFVNDYNAFSSNLQTQTGYTPGTGTAAGAAGPLNGNTSVVALQNQIEQTILSVIPNIPAVINNLSALGITPDSNGQLKIDSAKLNSALSGGVAGVTYNNIKNLFAMQGQSSSSGVQFATGSAATKASATPYQVNITQAATQAAVTGTSALAGSTVINGSNDTLSLTVDGKSSGTITLASGTYSALALASEVQTEINAATAANGGSVSVSLANNHLVITSNRYGSASAVTGLSGTSLSALGYAGTETSTGQNVAGYYTVNGVTEAATGVGQILTGNSTNANTAGLEVVVSLTPTQVGGGTATSNLTVTSGLASTLNNTLQSLLDPVNGQITLLAKQISQSITDAKAQVSTQTAAMSAQAAALLSQFAAMETTLANLQQEGNLLTTALVNSTSSSGSSSTSSTPTKTFTPNLNSSVTHS